MTPIRVLIVDDSRSMRQLIASVLGAAPDIDVVGQVADPIEARTAIKALNPDVVTLDVEMPRMNGLDFLEKVMRLRPTPVVMVSNLTQAGGEATIKALEIGAVDCVAKPQLGEAAPFASLAATIRAAASARMSGATRAVQAKGPAARRAGTPAYAPSAQVVVIGSSTGGVEALSTVLASFPANCPATMIVQHMPPLFTRSLAERLNRTCAPAVSEAVDGAPLVPGQVFIAPGGTTHHLEIAGGSQLRCRLKAAPPLNGHCPSVDMLFRSAARAAGREAIGVILTGMGRDGAEGLLEMRAAGARTFGQDAVSSLIYGMPKAAFDVGAVETQLGLAKIGPAILAAAAL